MNFTQDIIASLILIQKTINQHDRWQLTLICCTQGVTSLIKPPDFNKRDG